MDENLTEPPTWYNTSAAASSSSAHPAVEEEDFEEVAEEEPWDSSAPAVEEEDLEEVKPWDEETYPWRGKAGSARQAWAAQRSGWRKKRGGKTGQLLLCKEVCTALRVSLLVFQAGKPQLSRKKQRTPCCPGFLLRCRWSGFNHYKALERFQPLYIGAALT